MRTTANSDEDHYAHVNSCDEDYSYMLHADYDSLQWRHKDTMASQITSLTIVYSTVYSGTDQRKHQSSASLAFVQGIRRWPVNSPHKGLVTRKMFPFDDVIMCCKIFDNYLSMQNSTLNPHEIVTGLPPTVNIRFVSPHPGTHPGKINQCLVKVFWNESDIDNWPWCLGKMWHKRNNYFDK